MRKELFEYIKKSSKEDLLSLLSVARSLEESTHPRKVIIGTSELEKMKDIIQVFGSYIENQDYFDMVLSSKFGVVRMDIDGGISYYYTADDLFLRLVWEIHTDLLEPYLKGLDFDCSMHHKEALRQRIMPLVKKLRDEQHYTKLFEERLKKDEYSFKE